MMLEGAMVPNDALDSPSDVAINRFTVVQVPDIDAATATLVFEEGVLQDARARPVMRGEVAFTGRTKRSLELATGVGEPLFPPEPLTPVPTPESWEAAGMRWREGTAVVLHFNEAVAAGEGFVHFAAQTSSANDLRFSPQSDAP